MAEEAERQQIGSRQCSNQRGEPQSFRTFRLGECRAEAGRISEHASALKYPPSSYYVENNFGCIRPVPVKREEACTHEESYRSYGMHARWMISKIANETLCLLTSKRSEGR